MAQRDLAAGRLSQATYAAQRAAELSAARPAMARRYATALAAATRAGDDAWVRELIGEARARCELEADADIAVAAAFSLSRAGLQHDAMCALERALPAASDPRAADRAWRTGAAAAHVASQSGLPVHAAVRRDLGVLTPAPWHLAEVDAAPRGINYLLARGRWDEAEARVSEATARARGYGLTVLEVQVRALAATLTALRGDGRQARIMAELAWPVLELQTNGASHALLLRALGHAAFAEHDYGTALAHFEALTALHETHQALDAVEPDLALWATMSAVRAGEAGHAPELLDRMRVRRGPTGLRARLAISQARALLAGDDAAEAHYQLAVTTAGVGRWPFLLALGQLNYGIWLRRRRRHVHARGYLSEALAAFGTLRAEGFAAATRTELNAAGAARDDASRPGGLTPQQLEVARLAAQGLSNRLIADRMQITPRTVGAHLHSAFLRLGVSRRHLLQAALAGEPEAV
jgi:DNA-binding CsgD family transcriptional regulator